MSEHGALWSKIEAAIEAHFMGFHRCSGRVEEKLDQILARLPEPCTARNRELVLLQPTLTTFEGEPTMAAYPLKLNKVATFVLTLKNPTTGALDPVDPADVFSVTSSDPTNLQAVIGTNAAGQTAAVVNWLHTTSPMLTGVGIAITDSAGNTRDDAETFDMVAPDHVPDQIGIDVAGVTETDQAVPA